MKDTQKSAHELRAELRHSRITISILTKQVKAAQDCFAGKHQMPLLAASGGCFVCGANPE